MLLLFCGHSSKLGQKLAVVVVAKKLEVVVRKRATTTAHLSERVTAGCGHALCDEMFNVVMYLFFVNLDKLHDS